MAEIIEKKVVERTSDEPQSDEIIQTSTTNTEANYAVSKIVQIVYYITGLIIAILGIRFVLQLLGASRGSTFVDLIYSITEPLVAPFYGIFQNAISYGNARLELESLFAMIVYLLVGWAIANLFRLIR